MTAATSLRTQYREARHATAAASLALAEAVRERARWSRLDRLVREVVLCHTEEDLLFECILQDDGPTTTPQWVFAGEGAH